MNAHAYTLLETAELTLDGDQVHKLVKMRNPWAKEQYVGPWSDSSGQWTEEMRKQVGHTEIANDGSFYIPFKIFLETFDSTTFAIY